MTMQFGGFTSPQSLKLLTRDHPDLAMEYLNLDFYWHVAADSLSDWIILRGKFRGEVGLYQSATTTMPASLDLYPPAKYPRAMCKDSWFLRDSLGSAIPWPVKDASGKLTEPYRLFLDMRLAEVREALIGTMVLRAQILGIKTLCLDNCYWQMRPTQPWPMSKEAWTAAMMLFYAELWRAAGNSNLRVVLNVACPVNELFTMLHGSDGVGRYCDGIMNENPFHPNGDPKELLAYEFMAMNRKNVYLIPLDVERETACLDNLKPLSTKYPNRIYCTARGEVHKANY